MTDAPSLPRAASAAAWACAVLLALGIALLPLANFEALYTARVSQALAAQIGLLCLGALLLPALLLARRGHHELSRTDAAVLVFGAATVLSTLFGPAPAAFFRESLYAAAFLVVYFLVRWTRPSRGQLIVLGCGIVVAVLLVSVAGILQNRGIETLDYALKERRGKGQIVSLLGNPNYVASFLAPALFLLAGFAVAARQWVWRVIFVAVLLPLGWCLALAGGRAAWLGMLAGVFVVAVLLLMVRTDGRLKAWHWLLVAAAPIGAALLLLLALKISSPNFDIVDRLTSFRELHLRLFPWMIGRGMFLDHPLLGIGYGRFFAAYDPYVIEFFQASSKNRLYEYVMKIASGKRPDHLHNEYFQVLVETGLVGLAAFMAVLASATSGALARLRDGAAGRTERAAIALFLGAASCTAVDAFWGFPLRLPCSGLLFWLVLALLENNAASPVRALALPRRLLPSLVLAAALVASLGGATWASWQKLDAMKTRIHYWRNPALLEGNLDNVRELFRAHTLGSASHPPPFEIVDFYLRREAWRYARESILALANVYSLGSSGYLQLGVIEYQLGNVEEARDAFERALILEPDAPATLEFLAHAELQLVRIEEAEEHLQHAADLAPLSPNAYYLLGALREAQGRNTEAADYYLRAARAAVPFEGDLSFDPGAIRAHAAELAQHTDGV